MTAFSLRMLAALALAATVSAAFFLLSALLIRNDGNLLKAYYGDYELFYKIGVAAGIAGLLGMILGQQKSYSLVAALIGLNNKVHIGVSIFCWVTIIFIYLATFYGPK